MNQTRMLALLTSVREPHHQARGFDLACNINRIDRSAVTGLTSNGSNSVTIRRSAATKICVTETCKRRDFAAKAGLRSESGGNERSADVARAVILSEMTMSGKTS